MLGEEYCSELVIEGVGRVDDCERAPEWCSGVIANIVLAEYRCIFDSVSNTGVVEGI